MSQVNNHTKTMKYLVAVLCIFLLADGISASVVAARSRVRRNLVQFASMIECATGRDALDYNDYGCYCGWGGSGDAVDGIDECCKQHDQCYDDTLEDECSSLWDNPKYELYDWNECSSGTVQCQDDTECGNAACQCDRTAVLCFARHTYNADNKGNCP